MWPFKPNIDRLKAKRNVTALVRALNYRDRFGSVRYAAREALVELRDSRAVEPLIKALENKNDEMRNAAAEVLGELGDPRAVEPLIKVLEKGAYYTVAKALGQLGDSRAFEPLVKALEYNGLDINNATLLALGELGDPRAFEPLVKTLEEGTHYEYRGNAAEALGELGDPRAVEPLIKALGDDDVVCFAAADALGKLGDLRAVEPLINDLVNRNDYWHWSRNNVAGALAELSDLRAVEPLIKVLEKGYPGNPWHVTSDVHSKAALALVELGDTRAIEPLIRVLKNKSYAGRSAVAQALGEFGDIRAVEPLIKALDNGNVSFSCCVVKALGKLGDPRAVEPLSKILNDKHLSEILDDEHQELRESVADALKKLEDIRALAQQDNLEQKGDLERTISQDEEITPSTFKFSCCDCGQSLEAENTWVGMEFECPACKKSIVVPSP
jgi:HEAT repeat protein/predicted RNA-binding Zn-ribbon protein involved in translation (DUF1610 family)